MTSTFPLLDRLIARWELSRQASMPLMPSAVALLAVFFGLVVISTITGTEHPYIGRAAFASWLAFAGLDLARFLWTMNHPYATPRWLCAVHDAVGEDVAVHALAELMRGYDHDPDYVVRRFDMIAAVQNEKGRRREVQRRVQGFRLMPAEPDPQALADAERRRRARERRAARQARKAA